MQIILVGIGGALGSLTRYQLGKTIAQKSSSVYPIGTFAVNLSGAVFLGFIMGLNIEPNAYLLIGDGFLGAFTTFSTFMYESINLFKENEKKRAAFYVSTTLVITLIGYLAGFELGKLF